MVNPTWCQVILWIGHSACLSVQWADWWRRSWLFSRQSSRCTVSCSLSSLACTCLVALVWRRLRYWMMSWIVLRVALMITMSSSFQVYRYVIKIFKWLSARYRKGQYRIKLKVAQVWPRPVSRIQVIKCTSKPSKLSFKLTWKMTIKTTGNSLRLLK